MVLGDVKLKLHLAPLGVGDAELARVGERCDDA